MLNKLIAEATEIDFKVALESLFRSAPKSA